MTRLASLVLLALILSAPGAVYAALPPAGSQGVTANPEPRTPNPEREYLAYQAPNAGGDSVGWITFRLFSSLVLVGGLMAGGFYVYRRWMMRSPMAHRGELIRVVGRNYLGPKESLVMVRVGKDVLLLGVTAGQISFLQKWDEGKGLDVE
jgi:flagellar protein FliO/FliZ